MFSGWLKQIASTKMSLSMFLYKLFWSYGSNYKRNSFKTTHHSYIIQRFTSQLHVKISLSEITDKVFCHLSFSSCCCLSVRVSSFQIFDKEGFHPLYTYRSINLLYWCNRANASQRKGIISYLLLTNRPLETRATPGGIWKNVGDWKSAPKVCLMTTISKWIGAKVLLLWFYFQWKIIFTQTMDIGNL